MIESEFQETKDRLEVHELMYRYAEMVDKRNWKLMNRVFALEGLLDFTPSGGPSGPFREILAWLDRVLESWPINLHIISNIIVEFNGDLASCKSYFHTPYAREADDGSHYVVTSAGRFEDRLLRTRKGWRILERVCFETLTQGKIPEGYRLPD